MAKKPFKTITVTIKPEIYNDIKRKAELANMSMSKYLLYCERTGGGITIQSGMEDFKKELNQIGLKLDQLIRLCNINKMQIIKKDVLEIRQKMERIWEHLKQ